MSKDGEGKNNSCTSKPIWHCPFWLTAIVALISAFLTIPDNIANYFIAKEKTEALRLGNVEAKQEQEFKIVNNTLSKQGTERVFILRYLASTLDDLEAKKWAEGEVYRLDNLASRQEALDMARLKLSKKENDYLRLIKDGAKNSSQLKKELLRLKTELEKKSSEVTEIQKNAGITSNPLGFTMSIFRIKLNPRYSGNANELVVQTRGRDFPCNFKRGYCEAYTLSDAPDSLSISVRTNIQHLDIKTLFDKLILKEIRESADSDGNRIFNSKEVDYRCNRSDEPLDNRIHCSNKKFLR